MMYMYVYLLHVLGRVSVVYEVTNADINLCVCVCVCVCVSTATSRVTWCTRAGVCCGRESLEKEWLQGPRCSSWTSTYPCGYSALSPSASSGGSFLPAIELHHVKQDIVKCSDCSRARRQGGRSLWVWLLQWSLYFRWFPW